MTIASIAILFGVVLGLLVLAFAGIGIGILIGRRKNLQGCACEFNPEKARAAHRAGACCGGNCGNHSPSPEEPTAV